MNMLEGWPAPTSCNVEKIGLAWAANRGQPTSFSPKSAYRHAAPRLAPGEDYNRTGGGFRPSTIEGAPRARRRYPDAGIRHVAGLLGS